MRYFLDTEFNGFGGELISLALVPEDINAPELYLASVCKNPVPWVKENVIPRIYVNGKTSVFSVFLFGHQIVKYLKDDPQPIIIADWPDDIRYFCECLITAPGQMVNINNLVFQMIRVDSYPTSLEGAIRHNALWDARALRKVFLD